MRAPEAEELTSSPTQSPARREASSRRALVLLSLVQLLAMSLWFTGTAVIPQVSKLWHSDLAMGSWLTIAVQIGFSLGAIIFALFNISDIFSPIKVLFFLFRRCAARSLRRHPFSKGLFPSRSFATEPCSSSCRTRSALVLPAQAPLSYIAQGWR